MGLVIAIETALLIAAAYVIVRAFIVEPNRIEIERPCIPLPTLEHSMVFVHISDLHIKSWGRLPEATVALVEKAKPEFIVITGDLVEHGRHVPLAVRFVRALSHIAPVYGVLGNNDYAPGVDISRLIHELQMAGLRLLFNEAIVVTLANGWSFNVAGIDDPRTGRDDIEKAVSTLDTSLPTILLAHSPEVIAKLGDCPADLILCGHTHGGQVCLPWIGAVTTHTPLGRRYTSGLFRVGRAHLYVNRGLGTTFIPARLLSRPEVAVVTLKPCPRGYL